MLSMVCGAGPVVVNVTVAPLRQTTSLTPGKPFGFQLLASVGTERFQFPVPPPPSQVFVQLAVRLGVAVASVLLALSFEPSKARTT